MIKEIKDFENYYVSSDGKVYSKNGRWNKSLKELKQYVHNSGYCYVSFMKDNKKICKRVHKLVAEAFLHKKEINLEVNHKNGIKSDNRVENLEWITHSDNVKHRFRILKQAASKAWLGKFGKDHPNSRIVLQIKDGKIIKEFYGANEAGRAIHRNPSNITSCCRGRRVFCCGYQWRYKE